MLIYLCSKPSKPTRKRLTVTFAVLMVQRKRVESNLVNCNNVHDIVTTLNIDHNREERKLFTDSTKLNLKAVLPHHGRVLPSVTVRHTIRMNHMITRKLLNCLNCKKYQQHLSGDLEDVVICLGLQNGCIKFCCLLCELDS